MDDVLLHYFLHIHGVRNVRYTAPEFLVPIVRQYRSLTPTQMQMLKNTYEKNKSKVYNSLRVM